MAQLYNKKGDRYKVMQIEKYVNTTETDSLINTYMYTLYQHELSMAITELIEKGYFAQKSGEVYEAEMTLKGINAMKIELIDRIGEKEFLEIYNSIDLSFVKNKPNIPNNDR